MYILYNISNIDYSSSFVLYTSRFTLLASVIFFFKDTATTETYTYYHTLPLHDALPICQAMSYRIGAKDFDWVVDAIKIQASVGGNLSEIIEQVAEPLRARTRIKRQVDALTAEGKISALVLFFLPFGLVVFIFSSNTDYPNTLFSSGISPVTPVDPG